MFQLQCSGPVTGLCQVPHTGVLWVAAGGSVNYYEPKSGECVSATPTARSTWWHGWADTLSIVIV